MTLFDWLAVAFVASVVVIAIALVARRVPKFNAFVLDKLPDAGDKAFLALQEQLPGKSELRDKVRKELDELDAAFEAKAIAYLVKRNYLVTKATPRSPT